MAEFEGKGIVFFEFSNFGRIPKGSGYPLQSFGKPKRIFATIPCASCYKEALFENGNPFSIVSYGQMDKKEFLIFHKKTPNGVPLRVVF